MNELAKSLELIAQPGFGERPVFDRIAQLQAEIDGLRRALSAASGYLLNARIDLTTGAPKRTAIMTIDGGLKVVREALGESDKHKVEE
jgi:hypothetical protein